MKQKPPGKTASAQPHRLQRLVRALAEELWSIGYAEKCRVNKVKPRIKFDADDFDHAQKMAWLKIAAYVLKMKRPNDQAETSARSNKKEL